MVKLQNNKITVSHELHFMSCDINYKSILLLRLLNEFESGSWDEVDGILESICHHTIEGQLERAAGWFYEDGKKGYFYGIIVPTDYNRDIPDGMEYRQYPASEYLIFFHPPFNYLKDNGDIMGIVEQAAWNFDPTKLAMNGMRR